MTRSNRRPDFGLGCRLTWTGSFSAAWPNPPAIVTRTPTRSDRDLAACAAAKEWDFVRAAEWWGSLDPTMPPIDLMSQATARPILKKSAVGIDITRAMQ